MLLAGVWVVSFPPTGGYGVDVGTWSEGEPLVDLGISDEGEADAHLIATPEVTQNNHCSDSDADAAAKSSGSSRHHHVRTLSPTGYGGVSQTDASESPTTPSPSSPTRRRSTALTTPRRSRGSLMLLPQGGESILGPPGGSAISGFSIGLSPVSPGFSLVPRQRRRRTVAVGGGREEHGHDPGPAGLAASFSAEGDSWRRVAAPAVRRVVSDGDVSTDSDGLQDVERGEVASPREEDAHDHLDPDRWRAKKRWRWLRSVFSLKGHEDESSAVEN